jgi:hypothetical protein
LIGYCTRIMHCSPEYDELLRETPESDFLLSKCFLD